MYICTDICTLFYFCSPFYAVYLFVSIVFLVSDQHRCALFKTSCSFFILTDAIWHPTRFHSRIHHVLNYSPRDMHSRVKFYSKSDSTLIKEVQLGTIPEFKHVKLLKRLNKSTNRVNCSK